MTTRPTRALAACIGLAIGTANFAGAQTISVEGAGYTLSVNETGRVAVLELSASDYRRATVEGLSASRVRAFSKRIYNHFDDAFDFLIFMNDVGSVAGDFPYRGATHLANNSVRGIGLSRTDRSSLFGSDGQLQSAFHLATDDSLATGRALRELGRRWANALLPTQTEGFWGYSSAGGQLGGWVDGTLVQNPSTGVYSASGPGGGGWTPDGQNLGNGTRFSLIELYAMGLVPAGAVPPVVVARNPIPGPRGGFTTSDFETWDIERIEIHNGERRPDSTEAQRSFRAALVVLAESGAFPSPDHLASYDAQVAAFADDATDTSATRGIFSTATLGQATLKMDGLREFLTGTGEMDIVEIEIDPPALHVSIQADSITRYQIEHSSDLENWFPVGPERSGQGSPERVTILGVYTPTTAYLRLREVE